MLVIVIVDDKLQVLILVLYEVWVFNLENGKLIWYVEVIGDLFINMSFIFVGDCFVVLGECGGSIVVLKVGGKGDVSEMNCIWSELYWG